MYRKYIKRGLDFVLSLTAIVLLSPLFLALTVLGLVFMKVNPFFTQDRPGLREKIFKLVKFRTMTNAKGPDGELLPDEKRLIPYGKFLRATSLDEIPELFNILLGQMAIVGPRPLLTEYLPRYSAEQHRRHEVRPGLTGYAQAHGRNAVSWQERFRMDVWYVDHVSFRTDFGILLATVRGVLKHEGISSETSATMEKFMGNNT